MRIAQITDLHIGRAGENTFDIDVRANFRRILSKVCQVAPDYIVATGDLCYQDPDPLILQYVKDELDATGIPYFVISGNHDDSPMLATCFGLEEQLCDAELYYSRLVDGVPLLFLDSAVGRLSATQKQWLQNELQRHTTPVVVFIHHPPLAGGVPYMDNNHALQDRAEVAELLLQSAQPVHVFCGHYHIEQTVQRQHVQVHITPSGFFQIDPQYTDFAVEHHRVGFRDILWENGQLLHRVVWV